MLCVLIPVGVAQLLRRQCLAASGARGLERWSGRLEPVPIATLVLLFGFQSGAALATVVGVLIEVPVMLPVVAIVNRRRGWYERDAA